MKRREFNKLAGLTLASFATNLPLSGCTTAPVAYVPPKKGRVIAAGFATSPGVSPVRIYDWDTLRFSEMEIPIDFVHSVVQDNKDPRILYFFEVFGSGVKFNVATGAAVRIDHKKGQGMFNGHGTLLGSGDVLACSEMDSVRLRSTDDLSVVGELPVECRKCHQVISLPGSSLLATGSNFNGKAGITFYDYSTKKIVNRVDLEAPILHLLAISDHEVIGASLIRKAYSPTKDNHFEPTSDSYSNFKKFTQDRTDAPSPLVYASTDTGKKLFWDEKNQGNFRLNFGLAETADGRLISSHTNSNKVIVWKNYEIERVIEVTRPKNIQLSDDGSEFMVLAENVLEIYSTNTYEKLPGIENWPRVVATSSYKS